ncbi:MAG: hypothetical protein EBZ77_08710, partial [Chitinophagia bacterium]|nr:hypothetical protein [Chitinophagia bacterium]
MKYIVSLLFLLGCSAPLVAQTIVYQEAFDGMPGYSLVHWGYNFSGVVPWQCGHPYQLAPCMVPLGAMSENSGANKVACFAECGGFDFNDSNVLTYTPAINMSSVAGAWLKYDSYFVQYISGSDTERATVEASTDSGRTWTVLEQVAQSMPLGL